jgi:hypothetical protein
MRIGSGRLAQRNWHNTRWKLTGHLQGSNILASVGWPPVFCEHERGPSLVANVKTYRHLAARPAASQSGNVRAGEDQAWADHQARADDMTVGIEHADCTCLETVWHVLAASSVCQSPAFIHQELFQPNRRR